MNTSDQKKEIYKAIVTGDLASFKSSVSNDSTLMKSGIVFGTWLHIASAHGKLEIVEWLLNNGSELNAKAGIAGGSPINEAASHGQTKVVRYLLDQGAELDVSDPVRNPLFGAIQEGSLEIVKMLLEHGIDARVKYTGEYMKNMDAHAFAMEMGQGAIAECIRQWLEARPAMEPS